MAQVKNPSIIGKFPWLPYASGAIVLTWIVFVVFAKIQFANASVLHTATIADIASQKPTSGHYKVTGGVMNYVYAQAVGFTNDREKDAGEDFSSYVPYIDFQTKQVVMLVLLEHYAPKDFTQLIDIDKPVSQIGQFVDPNTVDPKLYPMFDRMQYPIARDTPVLVPFGGPPDPTTKIVITGILALLLAGGAWLICFQMAKPKVRRKSFSERYPDRRTY